MNLQQKIKKAQSERGFTIVELLIVIVVIGILAAIVIVVFNGVQQRAKTTSAKATASTIQKKIEAYNAATTTYPSTTTLQTASTGMTDILNSTPESKIDAGITLANTPTEANGQKTVSIYKCTSGNVYSVVWMDYGKSGGAGLVDAADGLKAGGDCTSWSATRMTN